MSRTIDLLTSAPDDVLRQLFQTFRLERVEVGALPREQGFRFRLDGCKRDEMDRWTHGDSPA